MRAHCVFSFFFALRVVFKVFHLEILKNFLKIFYLNFMLVCVFIYFCLFV